MFTVDTLEPWAINIFLYILCPLPLFLKIQTIALQQIETMRVIAGIKFGLAEWPIYWLNKLEKHATSYTGHWKRG